MILPAKQHTNFWRKVRVNANTGCWEWTCRRNKDGYGTIGGGDYRFCRAAHRSAYMQVNGPVEADKVVCHSCDNRLCVRPAHMFIGTQNDNIQDCVSKGRNARGEVAGPARLSEADVKRIRELYRSGGWTQRQLAEVFGVTQANISWIWRHGWKHVGV